MIRSFLAVLASTHMVALAHAQTIVPKLDQEGRRGDIARMVHERAVKQFDEADADKNGLLTREEVSVVAPYKGEAFEQYDKNGDGLLDWPEFIGHDRWKK